MSDLDTFDIWILLNLLRVPIIKTPDSNESNSNIHTSNLNFCLKYDSKNTFLKEKEIEIQKMQQEKSNLQAQLNLIDVEEKLAVENSKAAKIRDEIRKLESTELEVTLNPKVKQYNLKNKIYPKGRSTMGMPGTRAQKGKKKWKQIK